MPATIESIKICFIDRFRNTNAPGGTRRELATLDVDHVETKVVWSDGYVGNLFAGIHRNGDITVRRFMWMFVAYKFYNDQPFYNVPDELFGALRNALKDLKYAAPRGNGSLRQLFGDTEQELGGRVCCRLTKLFLPGFQKKQSKPKLNPSLIHADDITIWIRTSGTDHVRPAEPDEAGTILTEFDPVSDKTLCQLRQKEEAKADLIATSRGAETDSADLCSAGAEANKNPTVSSETEEPDSEVALVVPDDSGEFDAAALHETYSQTVDEMETLLAGNSSLLEFLLSACPQAFARSATGGIVSEVVRCGGSDMCSVLKAIKVNLPSLNNPQDRLQLLEVVGGLFVFAVNPHWVLKQRASMLSEAIVFQGRHDRVPFKQSQSAALLPLLTAALTDGFAHLEEVLGTVASRQLTVDPPKVGRGILKQDKRTELKLHFIDYLLKPDENLNRNNPNDIAEVFDQTCEMLTYAFEEKREPYFTSNHSYRELSSVIREDLKMEHLLLIFPSTECSDGRPITDPVYLFSHASEIFQSVNDSLAFS